MIISRVFFITNYLEKQQRISLLLVSKIAFFHFLSFVFLSRFSWQFIHFMEQAYKILGTLVKPINQQQSRQTICYEKIAFFSFLFILFTFLKRFIALSRFAFLFWRDWHARGLRSSQTTIFDGFLIFLVIFCLLEIQLLS